MFKLRAKRGQQEQGLHARTGERRGGGGGEKPEDRLDGGDASLRPPEYDFEVGTARKDKLQTRPCACAWPARNCEADWPKKRAEPEGGRERKHRKCSARFSRFATPQDAANPPQYGMITGAGLTGIDVRLPVCLPASVLDREMQVPHHRLPAKTERREDEDGQRRSQSSLSRQKKKQK